MLNLDRVLCDFKTPCAILAGAGVSMDSPAGLPNARSLIERALLHQISKVVKRDELPHIIDRPKDFPSRPGEYLRFEVAMAYAAADFRTNILNELQSGTPNANHYALAQLIKQGFIVITTNFDLHIETAYKHLYGRDCKVAHRDEDFTTPVSAKKGVLWKIHGSLTDMNNVAATFTTIFSKRSSRYPWFESILEKYDLIVTGYSGSDDLDLIPPLARTITDRHLLWVDHRRDPEWFTPQQWLARSPARMHLDCVGLTRVMFSCHSPQRPTRRDGRAMILDGPTKEILESVLQRAGVSPIVPAGPPPAVSKVNSPAGGELDEFNSASNLMLLLRHSRGPKVEQIVERARRQLVTYGVRQPASDQLRLVIELYNSKTVRQMLKEVVVDKDQIWSRIAANDYAAFIARVEEITPKLTEKDLPQALRLLGCLHFDQDPYQAQQYFERSIKEAREIGDLIGEMSTLVTYSDILYPSHFPMFWLNESPFPHHDRLYELEGVTGFVPMVGKGNLVRDLDYAKKLQIFQPTYVDEHAAIGFFDVYQHATEARRMAIDLGDVAGELQATFIIAELTLVLLVNHQKVPGFSGWVECQRLSLLADELGMPKEFGEKIMYVMGLPRAEHDFTQAELRASMFPPT